MQDAMTAHDSPAFVPGLELCRRFYWEAVRPILDAHWPDLPHGAALLGGGSEVLGFDDATSTDHHWGPRVMLFLSAEDHAQWADAIDAVAPGTALHLPGPPDQLQPA